MSIFGPHSLPVRTLPVPRPELLLHPNIPKPLHGMSPRELLGQEWWDEQRQKAYAKSNYCCEACGVPKQEAKYHKWLEAHETYVYNYGTGTATVSEIVALCHACHNYIHSGKLRADYDAGRITKAKYLDILDHGTEILLAAKLAPLDQDIGYMAPWNQWKIIIDGKTFPTKWPSYQHWSNHYHS